MRVTPTDPGESAFGCYFVDHPIKAAHAYPMNVFLEINYCQISEVDWLSSW